LANEFAVVTTLAQSGNSSRGVSGPLPYCSVPMSMPLRPAVPAVESVPMTKYTSGNRASGYSSARRASPRRMLLVTAVSETSDRVRVSRSA
jgi:hypothetical protein